MPENRIAQRLEALHSYGILDTPSEKDFDDLAELAAAICGTPIALVSLVDEHRQWFKAERGLGVRQTPIEQSVCACVMHEPGPLQVPDLQADARFASNPLVVDDPRLRFYAGAPLRTPDGFELGMLCVLDRRPRELSAFQLDALRVLARQAVVQMETRRQAALAAQRASALTQALREREAAASVLRRSEQEHRFVVDHVLAGLVIHDSQGSLLFANELACKFLGLTRDQIAGKTPADPAWRFLRPDGSVLPLEDYPIMQVLRDRRPLRDMVVGVVRSQGTAPVWGLVHAHPQHDEGGQMERVVVSFVDVTALKRLEEQLVAADRRKDEFLATLAHELRNPLAPIRSAAEVLRSGRANQSQADWCHQVIARQAAHMGLLLDDLLDISRISRGKLQIRKEDVPLTELVDAACEVALPLIRRKEHRLERQLPADAILLHVDKVRISQVLGNLLTNAAKYTDPGGLIRLGAEWDAEGVCFWVEDTGIGLAPGEVEQVFQLFGQASDAAARSEGGLGIGLALSRGIVELHGGSLEAWSSGRGQGSRFTARLPASSLARSTSPPANALPGSEPVRARRILVADDNVDASQALALLLQAHGHRVEICHRGDHALQRLRENDFDVAFIDIAMPGLDGYAVAAGLREHRPAAATLLVALTGYDQPGAKQRSAASGFDRHLTKPVDPARLVELLSGFADAGEARLRRSQSPEPLAPLA